MKYFIYGLYSTEDGIIRYIGQTKSSLKQRKNEHKCDALTRNLKSHKCNWIRRVYKNGFEVEIKLIEETNEQNWAVREIFWINEYSKTTKLVNQLSGGNCGGIGGKLKNYLEYEEAKEFVKNNLSNAKSGKEYRKEYEEKRDIVENYVPKNPHHVYGLRGSWKGWGDYLSTGTISAISKHKTYLDFDTAHQLVLDAKLKNKNEYLDFIKEYKNLPRNPERSYEGKWVDWSFFLTGKKHDDKFSYNDFCRYIAETLSSLPSIDEYKRLYSSGLLNKRCPYHLKRKYGKNIVEIRKDIDKIVMKK